MSPFAIVDFFEGTKGIKKLLKRIRIPLSIKTVTIIWFMSGGILIISCFLRKILFQ